MVRGECAHLELLATFGPFGLSVVIENGLLQFFAATSHSLGIGSLVSDLRNYTTSGGLGLRFVATRIPDLDRARSAAPLS
jgi:hypothetical protein